MERLELLTPLSQSFVEIGCADGLQNNTHQLVLDGYCGVWIDASETCISRIESALGARASDRLLILRQRVSMTTGEALARRASYFLSTESIDFLSLDIDGNDIHVISPFLCRLNPKLVCVEYNAKFPPPTRVAMAYSEAHEWGYDDYFGASLQAWVEAMAGHGYSLVACNLSGVNAFFVRDDLMQGFTRYSANELYQPPRYWLADSPKGHAASLQWLAQAVREHSVSFQMVPVQALDLTCSTFAIHRAEDEFISGDLARSGIWEPFETKVFGRLCLPADIVLDLGANIGWYSMLAARRVGAQGRVIAFEPDRANARLLEVNAATIDEHAVVDIHKMAVSDQVGQFLLYRSETNLGDHRLFHDETERDSYPVMVTTLDTFFAEHEGRLPDLVKSDTQGSEARIFRGAAALLAGGWRPVFILEFWPFGLTRSGDNPMAFWQSLLSLGYQVFEVAENNPVLVPLREDRLLCRLDNDLSSNSWGFINLLCIPEGSARLDLIRDMVSEHVVF
jgi:FkbM family methyltransferase